MRKRIINVRTDLRTKNNLSVDVVKLLQQCVVTAQLSISQQVTSPRKILKVNKFSDSLTVNHRDKWYAHLSVVCDATNNHGALYE